MLCHGISHHARTHARTHARVHPHTQIYTGSVDQTPVWLCSHHLCRVNFHRTHAHKTHIAHIHIPPSACLAALAHSHACCVTWHHARTHTHTYTHTFTQTHTLNNIYVHLQDLSTKRLSGGARIRAVFNEMYSRAISDMAPMKEVSDDAILTVIKNGAGVAGGCV